MAQCLHPIFIRIDRRDKCPSMSKYHTKYRDVRPSSLDLVPVPCGKCINCLKNKQNAMVVRCCEEASHRGSFVFVTLTYSDENLPISHSLWRLSKETGEYERLENGEVIAFAGDDTFVVRSKVLSLEKSNKPMYYEEEIKGFEDDEYVYRVRYTPSVCRRDVRLWLKRSRVRYEREHGFKLSPFSYVLVSEYGPNTCRPHYHLAFFGLNKLEAEWLCKQWTFGYTNCKYVNRINPDGSDGFQIASRYIGKYMSKGKFECESVSDKSAEKPRVCQSKGIGASLLDKVRDSLCAFDMFGEYDLDSLFCPSLGRSLNENEINQLCNEIPNRLYFSVRGSKLPIPRVIREKVFCHRKEVKQRVRKFFSDDFGRIVEREVSETKIIREPTTLWLMVSASIREHFSADNSRKFLAYLSEHAERPLADSCSEYDYYEEVLSQIAEFASEKVYIDFLSKSCF